MSKLTEEQIQKYLEHPYDCPKCGHNVTADSNLYSSGDSVYQNIICNNCKSSWVDVYTLTGIGNFTEGNINDTIKDSIVPAGEKEEDT